MLFPAVNCVTEDFSEFMATPEHAAQQALDALKKCNVALAQALAALDLAPHLRPLLDALTAGELAVSNLREALATRERAAEPVAWRWLYNGKPADDKYFSMPGPAADVTALAESREFPRKVQYLYALPSLVCEQFAVASEARTEELKHATGDWYQSMAELAAVYGEICAINETPLKNQTMEQAERLKVLRAECINIHYRRIALNAIPISAQAVPRRTD